LFLSVFAYSVYGQAISVNAAKKQLRGTWLSNGDSTCELLITADSITTFRFRLNGVSRCSYSLSSQPCEKVVKFPASTGIYLAEKYNHKTLCYAMAAISSTAIKIIYPNGNEVVYKNESVFLNEAK